MGSAWTPGEGWRGWSALPGEGGHSITSARLPSDAPVKNHLFPKTRSWFALGAPLELLSPLSVLRILHALGTLLFPLLAFPFGLSGAFVVLAGVVCGLTAVAWYWQLKVREVNLGAFKVLSAAGNAAAVLLVLAEQGRPVAFAFVAFLIPFWVTNAFFLDGKTMLGFAAVGSLALFGALVPADGFAAALLVALVVLLVGTIAAGSVAFLVRENHRQGAIDPDTGLPNGVGLAQHFLGPDRHERFVIAAILLEGINEAREALGHRVAVELLRRAVEHLGQVLPSGTVIGRLDGDQLVLAKGLDTATGGAESVEEARTLARTLAEAISRGSFDASGVEINLRPHVGLARYPDDGDEIADLIRRAALGARTAATRSRTDVFLGEHEHEAMTAEDLTLLAALGGAPGRGDLTLAYQPQIDARSGRTAAVEASLRWRDPVLGSVSPARFIRLAEWTGLIDRITDWVLTEALDAQLRWRARGVELPVSVNFSAKTLTREDFPEWILAELSRRGLPPSALAVEVTETSEAADLLLAVSLLRPLHDVGVRISIDDFGTGYTSLSVLPQLPLDELKCDQGFVLRSPFSLADDAIVRTVRELAHRLGLQAVAEGVEDETIRRKMVDSGFDLQGFVFAKPLCEADLLAFVALNGLAAHPPVVQRAG
ncbi:MAG TPA: GGDEF domain-containing phosphodiesterase [Acidimicrobiales bacterium]|nr:GGDEF domain-containing phosphodiesterase [Acidimicrobiales bacterium]